ncbi:MAG: hypothetical protein EB015_11825 [Methylocystaceae bacterium]|nr:hypothetical protein [Methylocystaceae bacterium]
MGGIDKHFVRHGDLSLASGQTDQLFHTALIKLTRIHFRKNMRLKNMMIADKSGRDKTAGRQSGWKGKGSIASPSSQHAQ